MHTHATHPVTSSSAKTLKGDVTVPGDKSISHRSLMFASQAVGRSIIRGLLEGEDVLATAGALRQMGVSITRNADGSWIVDGVGVGGLQEPSDVLNMANAGTGARLMMGLLASYPFTSFFTGDASLRSRPMQRVIGPLMEMGATFHAHTGNRLPLALKGGNLVPITYRLPVASAQVKSAVLLAGLNTPGKTTVIEVESTRDHTERMLRFFGAEVQIEQKSDGTHITLTGQPEFTAHDIDVPGDPSSAAFLIVAALLVPGSEVTLRNICMNPARTGLFDTLREMGANLTFTNEREMAGEPIADITARYSELHGINVPAFRAPSMIDEYPVLSVAASCAKGVTIMNGLEELKVKESNRLKAIADGLKACCVNVEEGDASLTVTGNGNAPKGGGTIATHMDHRIAMSFLVMGLVSEKPVTVDDSQMIATSFPGFLELMNKLGGNIGQIKAA
ncbi:MAG: 3-phosphoshikimate 1-carboxyvinyltransferase [Rickettsiales bacterium]|jgi:3-phosphoshikimate 1-carboxyvinyltransferase|nr:3-phosphoshikimate 1-carboxyvinyltransferase [Rickettsiales bacterium]